MKSRLLLPLACVASLFVGSASAQPSLDPRTLTADLPFAMAPVALPQIPERTCRITDHGARGDGATLDTEAITLRRVEIAAEAGPALAVSNSRNVTVEGGASAPGTGVFLRVDGASSRDIRLKGVDLGTAKTPVETGAEVAAGAVVRR